MKNSFKKLPGSQIQLEVSLEQKEFLPYYQTAYDKALANVHLKGFRPGTAPKEMADAAVDKEEVFNQASQVAIRWSLDEITKDHEWVMIDPPRVEVEDAKDLGIKYKATLTLFPEVRLGNYKKIAHKVMGEKKEVSVEAGELEKTLEWLKESRKKDGQLPEINDEFAKTVGKFQNVEELEKSVNEGILMEKQFKERDRLRLKILEEVIKASEVDLPEIMVEKTYVNLNKQFGPILKASGKKEEEIVKELKERAKRNVLTNLVIYKISQAENLQPKPEEVGEEGDRGYNYGMVLNEKVYAFLEGQA